MCSISLSAFLPDSFSDFDSTAFLMAFHSLNSLEVRGSLGACVSAGVVVSEAFTLLSLFVGGCWPAQGVSRWWVVWGVSLTWSKQGVSSPNRLDPGVSLTLWTVVVSVVAVTPSSCSRRWWCVLIALGSSSAVFRNPE